MLTNTIETSQLDSIMNAISIVNEHLVKIESKTGNDTVLKWVTLIVTATGVFVGLRIFYLTRRKEYRYKKSEIAGEIYACISELKILATNNTFYRIFVDGNKRIIELLEDEEAKYVSDFEGQNTPEDKTIHDISVYIQRAKDNDKKNIDSLPDIGRCNKSLQKCIGQYRFFLERKKLSEFTKLARAVELIVSIKYDFSKLDTIKDVEQKMEECITQFKTDLSKKYSGGITELQKFIDDNQN